MGSEAGGLSSESVNLKVLTSVRGKKIAEALVRGWAWGQILSGAALFQPLTQGIF